MSRNESFRWITILTIRVNEGKNVKVVFVQERLSGIVTRLVALDELLRYVFNGANVVRNVFVSDQALLTVR